MYTLLRSSSLTGVFISLFLQQAVAGLPNTPPTISHTPHQVVQKNTASSPIPFTIGDAETSPGSLFVTAVAKDTSLIPTANLILGGSGANRTITITPGVEKIGQDSIFITVSDGVDSTTDAFGVKVNDPPFLDYNTLLSLNEGATATIVPANLHALDSDNPDSQIVYTLGPTISDAPPLNGTVMLNGNSLLLGQSFTQVDVINNRVTYRHNGNETTSDFFTFGVTDADGGVASDRGFSVFQFHISIAPVNDPPIANDTTYYLALGVGLNGTLRAYDPDSPTLFYSIVTNGTLGTATITDSATGAFTYTATVPGTVGVDSFAFQVYDQNTYALSPGKIRIVMANTAPVAYDDSLSTLEGVSVSGVLHAADSDLPPQPLWFAIIASGHLGTASMIDSTAGTFLYVPSPGARGVDTLIFYASDGLMNSASAMVRVKVHPRLHAGEIVVVGNGSANVIIIDSATGAQTVYASGAKITKPRGVAVAPSGNVYVWDETNGLVGIDPASGVQWIVSDRSNFTSSPLGPLSIAAEADGNILVADGTAGLRRVNPSNGALSTVSSGGLIVLAAGVAVNSNGKIILSDATAFAGGQSKILSIDPVNGNQAIISQGGTLTLPVGVAVDELGNIFITDATTFAGGPADQLIRIDPVSGAQKLIIPADTLHIPVGVAVDASGKILISQNQAKSVIKVDSLTGVSTTLTSNGSLKEPFQITIVKPQPKFLASTGSMEFRNVSPGSAKTDSMTVTNTGAAPLYIVSVAADSVQFSVAPTSAVIPVSGSTTFYVTYTPTADDTIHSRIVFTHNAYHSPTYVNVVGSGTVLGVQQHSGDLPKQFALYANYPNPFNPTTTFAFDVPAPAYVTIKVYTILGAEAATLVNHQQFEPGKFFQRFGSSNLSSGVYFYEMMGQPVDQAMPAFRSVKKMIMVK